MELPPRVAEPWAGVERLVRRGKAEVERTAAALLDLGWTLVTTRDGTWRAHHRGRHRSLDSYTSAGLVRAVRALESGATGGQLELLG